MDNTMSLKNSKARNRKKRGDADISKHRAELKANLRDGKTNTIISMHNSFIALVFGLAMMFVAIVSIQASYMIIGLMIGRENGGALDTVADLIIVLTTIIMAGGFMLFFALKLENWMLKKMRERFWHKDKATGEIDKGKNAADDGSDTK